MESYHTIRLMSISLLFTFLKKEYYIDIWGKRGKISLRRVILVFLKH